MKHILFLTTLMLAGCNPVPRLQATGAPQQQAVAPASPAPAGGGLRDLDAMTFACPKAGLNAAAREAAKVPAQGTYQFSYFRIINDSHHSAYEVHFKSNYQGEPDLKYCVSMYCQQGWDPTTATPSVSRVSDESGSVAAGTATVAECGAPRMKLEH